MKKKEWEENRSISFAADLVATGVALGEKQYVHDAAEFILSHRVGQSETAKALANHVLGLSVKDEWGIGDVEAEEFEGTLKSL